MLNDGSFLVGYYIGEGELEWKIDVQNSVASDKYEAYNTTMETTHSSKITVTDWMVNSVGN